MMVDVVQYSQRCSIIGHIGPLRWVLWSDFSSIRSTPMFGDTSLQDSLYRRLKGSLVPLSSSAWILFVIAMCHQMVVRVLRTLCLFSMIQLYDS
jgi:hypothetical protein